MALDVSGSDYVHVDRVHMDSEDPYVFCPWVAADNLRVGAALDAVEIPECMYKRGIV
jgi:aspartate-semialdehyde dehydrogenase